MWCTADLAPMGKSLAKWIKYVLFGKKSSGPSTAPWPLKVQKSKKDFWVYSELYDADLLVGVAVHNAIVGLLAPYVRIEKSSASAGLFGRFSRMARYLVQYLEFQLDFVLGKEGPMVHTGACIANLLGQGLKGDHASNICDVIVLDKDR